nr:hypothetical protein [uncultured Dongia sp.]
MHTSSYETAPLARPLANAWLYDAAGDIQELYLYWAECRAGRVMPRRDDVDFAALVAGFPRVLLAEANAARETPADSYYIYRALGHEDFAYEGYVGEGLDPALFRHIPDRGCHAATVARDVHTERVRLLSGDGLIMEYEVAFLPLGPEGGAEDAAVDGILILAVELAPGTMAGGA